MNSILLPPGAHEDSRAPGGLFHAGGIGMTDGFLPSRMAKCTKHCDDNCAIYTYPWATFPVKYSEYHGFPAFSLLCCCQTETQRTVNIVERNRRCHLKGLLDAGGIFLFHPLRRMRERVEKQTDPFFKGGRVSAERGKTCCIRYPLSKGTRTGEKCGSQGRGRVF